MFEISTQAWETTGCRKDNFGLFSKFDDYQEPFFREIFLFSLGTQRHYQCETQVVFELQI